MRSAGGDPCDGSDYMIGGLRQIVRNGMTILSVMVQVSSFLEFEEVL